MTETERRAFTVELEALCSKYGLEDKDFWTFEAVEPTVSEAFASMVDARGSRPWPHGAMKRVQNRVHHEVAQNRHTFDRSKVKLRAWIRRILRKETGDSSLYINVEYRSPSTGDQWMAIVEAGGCRQFITLTNSIETREKLKNFAVAITAFRSAVAA